MLVTVALIAILTVTGCAPPPCPSEQMTTVLLARHAEKVYPPHPDDRETPLSPTGEARAAKLALGALKAGGTAIYVTEYKRTQQTAEPLADSLGLEPIIYTAYVEEEEIVGQILEEHEGDVVLVVGHQPTVPGIVDKLGGNPASCPIGNEFDNLCIVTICRRDQVEVVNLQYGEPSP
jgi:broad specificity phosphatase PhoE